MTTLALLSDPALILFTRALEPDPIGLTEIICDECGEAYTYLRTGPGLRKTCPDCGKLRKHLKNPWQRCTNPATKFVQFRGVNLNYRRGCWYQVEVVRADVADGLANLCDFDFDNARMEVLR